MPCRFCLNNNADGIFSRSFSDLFGENISEARRVHDARTLFNLIKGFVAFGHGGYRDILRRLARFAEFPCLRYDALIGILRNCLQFRRWGIVVLERCGLYGERDDQHYTLMRSASLQRKGSR